MAISVAMLIAFWKMRLRLMEIIDINKHMYWKAAPILILEVFMTPQEDTEYIDPDIHLRNPCPLMGGEEVKGCGRAAGGYLAYIGSSSLTDVPALDRKTTNAFPVIGPCYLQ